MKVSGTGEINKLILEIFAVNEDNKNIIYTIPIKLNDSCKQG